MVPGKCLTESAARLGAGSSQEPWVTAGECLAGKLLRTHGWHVLADRGEARAEGRTEGLTVLGEAQAEGTRACTSVGVRGPILAHAQKVRVRSDHWVVTAGTNLRAPSERQEMHAALGDQELGL